jgi:DnaK suppressor protein
MNKAKLEEFRQLLQEQMDQLLRASLESDRNFELRIRDRERRLIGKIREALDRIDSGEFGECEDCGDQIGEARLKARPVTTLCIECKTEQERQEKIG